MRLTVATWNLYLGAEVELLLGASSLEDLAERAQVLMGQLARTDFTERAATVARLVVEHGVEVLGLQEVSRLTSAPLHGDSDPAGPTVLADYLPTLLAALESHGAVFDVHAADVSFDGGLPVEDRWVQVTGSNVLLVRRGVGLEVVDEATGRFARAAELELAVGGLTFPVRRGWGRVDVERDGARVRVLNTHTEAWDAPVRDAQRDELLAVADGSGPAVLLGDLNATPDEVGVPAPWVDAWLAAGGDPGGGLTCGQSGDLSNESTDLRSRIDYVFTRGLTVRTCTVGGGRPQDRTPSGLWPSDHAAVVAELEVP